MNLFRWRIRTLMAVVAIVAILSTVEETRRRGQSYRLQAEYHLAASRQLANESNCFLCGFGLTEQRREAIEARRTAERSVVQEAVEYHTRLHRKYQLASETPWLTVDPDPPPPPRGNPTLATADDY